MIGFSKKFEMILKNNNKGDSFKFQLKKLNIRVYLHFRR